MRCRPTSVAVLVSVILLSTVGCGRTGALKDPSGKAQPAIPVEKALTADDILSADLPFGPYISPDGAKALWIRAFYREGYDMPHWEVNVTDLETRDGVVALSGAGMMPGKPKWSPDGSSFACVLPAVDGTDQLFTIAASGGVPFQVSEVPGGVLAHAWRDASTLVFTAPVAGEERGGDDTIHVALETDDKIRLFQVPSSGGDVIPLTKNEDRITDFWISPDGSKALTVRTSAADGKDAYYGEIPMRNYLVDLTDGSQRRVCENVREVLGATWSPDSAILFVEEGYTPDTLLVATTTRLLSLDVRTGTEMEVDLHWERGIHSQTGGTSAVCQVTGGFLAMLADGCTPRLAFCRSTGRSYEREMLKGEHQGHVFAFDATRDGTRICYLYSTPSVPPQMYVADISSGAIVNQRPFTDLNPGWAAREFVRSEIITWRGVLGRPVEGILYYPSGYEPGRRYPLVLMIHGGPFHVDLAEWQSNTYAIYPYQLMARKGAFVLAANYHGSSEYGLEFARSIRDGHFYEYPVIDIENGISRLVELGMVDENRMAALGWSNGSILSHALIARDTRFRAASCGAGGSEWLSLWGPAAEGYALLEYYFGASPVEDPNLYKDAAMAPFYNARRVETPVVMYQGDADRSVPPGMTWVAYRGLQKYGRAPVELFIFPGEGHDIVRLTHLERKLTEDMKWFDRYLFDER